MKPSTTTTEGIFLKRCPGKSHHTSVLVHPEGERKGKMLHPHRSSGREGGCWQEGPRGHPPHSHPGDSTSPRSPLPAPSTCLRVGPEALMPPPPASLEEQVPPVHFPQERRGLGVLAPLSPDHGDTPSSTLLDFTVSNPNTTDEDAPWVTVRVSVAATGRRGWRKVHGSTWRVPRICPQRAHARSRELTSGGATRPHPRHPGPSHAPGSAGWSKVQSGAQNVGRAQAAPQGPWPPPLLQRHPRPRGRGCAVGGEAGAGGQRGGPEAGGAVSAQPTAIAMAG